MTSSDQAPPTAPPVPAATPPIGGDAPGGQPAQASPLSPAGTGLATAALVVGIVAFLIGWATIIGGIVAIAGIVLGIIAVRRRRARVRSIVGLSLSGVAFLTNLVITVIFLITVLTPGAFEGLVRMAESNGPDSSVSTEDGAEGADTDGTEASGTDLQTTALPTPCYSFDAPAAYINNQSAEATAACATSAELWGEYAADGTVLNTGVGSILGSVNVEAVSSVAVAEFAPDGTLETMMGYLNAEFIPVMGAVIGQPETVTIDGTPATLTRVTSTVAATKTKALLVLRAPEAYQVTDKEVQFFLLSFVIPEDNGDAIIDAAKASWTWQ